MVGLRVRIPVDIVTARLLRATAMSLSRWRIRAPRQGTCQLLDLFTRKLECPNFHMIPGLSWTAESSEKKSQDSTIVERETLDLGGLAAIGIVARWHRWDPF